MQKIKRNGRVNKMGNIIEVTSNGVKLSNLQDYLAELSAVVRDKDPKSAEKLWKRLKTESFGDTASRVFEYIPCKVKKGSRPASSQHFGFTSGDNYYTNMRELLNLGWGMEKCLKHVDFKHYRVFKCETPYFIYGQVSTHTQLTTVSHSQRYAECDRGYFKPAEITKISQEAWDKGIKTWRPNELRDLMKRSGVVRKEIFDRGGDMLQNRVFVIGGYTNNPNAWEHFLEQRLDSHTQAETREFAEGLAGFMPEVLDDFR